MLAASVQKCTEYKSFTGGLDLEEPIRWLFTILHVFPCNRFRGNRKKGLRKSVTRAFFVPPTLPGFPPRDPARSCGSTSKPRGSSPSTACRRSPPCCGSSSSSPPRRFPRQHGSLFLGKSCQKDSKWFTNIKFLKDTESLVHFQSRKMQ